MPRRLKSTATVAKPESDTSRSQAEKYLAKVPEKQVFWCNNGAVLNDVMELKDALANMSDQTYAYHANEIKQDFSNWIRNVIGDNKLAKDLETAASREQAVKLVEERCAFLAGKRV